MQYVVVCYYFLACLRQNVRTTVIKIMRPTKEALESRVNDVMAEQNRLIDSLIAAADKRLKKDKNGEFLSQLGFSKWETIIL